MSGELHPEFLRYLRERAKTPDLGRPMVDLLRQLEAREVARLEAYWRGGAGFGEGKFGEWVALKSLIWQIEIERADTPDTPDPPKIAEFILMVLASNAEAMLGDLNERFTDDCQRIGKRRATRLYWARTLRSIGPILIRWLRKALKWGVVIEAARRLF
jgi:hypothetical protein